MLIIYNINHVISLFQLFLYLCVIDLLIIFMSSKTYISLKNNYKLAFKTIDSNSIFRKMKKAISTIIVNIKF